MAQELVGRTLYVGWPYLAEAKVCAVSDGREKYHDVSDNVAPVSVNYSTVYVYGRVNTCKHMYVQVCSPTNLSRYSESILFELVVLYM